MIGRVVVLAGGLSGAAGLSQFPEYSQQYTQRLAGAVDELTRFVSEFDADARGLGLSRQEALAELADGGAMGAARAQTMEGTLFRYDRLTSDLRALQNAGPFMRAYHAGRLSDAEIAEAAWQDYRPAMPLSFEGAVFGGVGLVAGMCLMALVIGLIRMPFRRRRAA
ncbi:DUF2937 family protein [Shimia sp.]|uniref:DUF2937 family protein n=1 Tax=Shimia sp. TaxID=1954381 RepID=UPI003297F8C9